MDHSVWTQHSLSSVKTLSFPQHTFKEYQLLARVNEGQPQCIPIESLSNPVEYWLQRITEIGVFHY
jgi:hypothetical protein